MNRSVCFWEGEYTSSFGYKDDEGKTISKEDHFVGLTAPQLTAEDYQRIMDRNWRRCGTHIYQPVNSINGCRMFAIRLNCMEFQPSRSQRKALDRLDAYCAGNWAPGVGFAPSCGGTPVRKKKGEKAGNRTGNVESSSLEDWSLVVELQQLICRCTREVLEQDEVAAQTFQRVAMDWPVKVILPAPGKAPKNQVVHLCSPSVLALCGLLRKHASVREGLSFKDCNTIAALVADRLRDASEQLGFETVSVSKGFLNFTLCPELVAKWKEHVSSPDMEVDGGNVQSTPSVAGPSDTGSMSTSDGTPFGRHVFTMELTTSEVNTEKFDLFSAYQESIHDDGDKSVKSFDNFLCTSPLVSDESGPLKGYGTYHVEYRMDGRLFAVGVVDVLPGALSSVYTFYHPDFHFLRPGILSALKEIELVKDAMRTHPDCQFYYMGYYIHECPKMRYKGDYRPSYVLCSDTYTWHPLESAVEKMERRQSRFAGPEVPNPKDEEEIDLGKIAVLLGGRIPATVQMLKLNTPDTEEESRLKSFVHAVGKEAALSMFYYVIV